MRKLITVTMLLVACFAIEALAQQAGVPVAVASAAPGGGAIAFVEANWGLVIAPFLVALADLLFAVNPNWRSNGLAHWVFLQLGGKDTPPASS